MKYYLIDEVSPSDMERATAFLKENATMSGMEKVFWVKFPDKLLSESQSGHRDCQPFFFAIELGAGIIKAEFYIRTLKGLKCSCSGYSDPGQSRFIIRFVDEMIRELKIRT